MEGVRDFPSEPDVVHLDWLTCHPYVARREREILSRVTMPPGRFLEIGAGEGANLHHLAERADGTSVWGLELSTAKVSCGR